MGRKKPCGTRKRVLLPLIFRVILDRAASDLERNEVPGRGALQHPRLCAVLRRGVYGELAFVALSGATARAIARCQLLFLCRLEVAISTAYLCIVDD